VGRTSAGMEDHTGAVPSTPGALGSEKQRERFLPGIRGWAEGLSRGRRAGFVPGPFPLRLFQTLRPLLVPLTAERPPRRTGSASGKKKGKGEKKVRANRPAEDRDGKSRSVLRSLHERHAAIKIARIARYHRGFKQKRNARNDSDRMIARLMSCCTHRSSRGRTFAVEEDHTDAKRPSGLPRVARETPKWPRADEARLSLSLSLSLSFPEFQACRLGILTGKHRK